MAKNTQKTNKTESLTIRLDPKTRFILEFVSKLKGQTITTVVERAIVNSASGETLRDFKNGGDLTWHDFWDISDGVRALQLAARSEFFPSFEEEKRLAFCKEHWPFFWSSKERKTFLNYYVDVLWPNIDAYVQIHDDTKATDYFAAGKAMRDALSAAKLKAPEWPRPAEPLSVRAHLSKTSDDDIPF